MLGSKVNLTLLALVDLSSKQPDTYTADTVYDSPLWKPVCGSSRSPSECLNQRGLTSVRGPGTVSGVSWVINWQSHLADCCPHHFDEEGLGCAPQAQLIIGEQKGNAHVTLYGKDFNQSPTSITAPRLFKTAKKLRFLKSGLRKGSMFSIERQ